jgi:hypothetical protein
VAQNIIEIVFQSVDKMSGNMRRIDSSISRVDKGVNKLRGGLLQLAGAFGVAFGARQLAQMVRSQIDAADNFLKLTQRIGGTTEAFSELDFVARRSNVEFGTLTMSLQRMTRGISEAAVGTGTAKNALAELDLSATKLSRIPLDTQFEVLAEALSKVENEADRVRLAVNLFGIGGAKLLQTMEDGAAGIRELRVEAQRLGLTVTREMGEKAAAANDAITNLKAGMEGLTREMAINLAPAMEKSANWLAQNMIPIVEGVAAAWHNVIGTVALATHTILRAVRGMMQIEVFLRELIPQAIRPDMLGTGRLKEMIAELEGLEVSMLDIAAERFERGTEAWRKVVDNFNIAVSDTTVRPGGGVLDGLGGADADLSKLSDRLRSLEESLDPLMGLTREYTEAQLLLNEAYANSDPERFAELMDRLNERFREQVISITGANQAMEDWARSQQDHARAIERFNDQLVTLDRMLYQVPAAVSAFNDAVALLNEGVQLGAIGWDEYMERLQLLSEAFEEGRLGSERAFDAMASIADEAARGIHRIFADFLFDPFADGLKGMLKNFADMLRRMVAELLAKKILLSFLGNFSGTGGFFGNLADALGKGLSHGGFTSPGKLHPVNEREPEFLVTRNRSEVIPLSKMGQSGMGGNQMVFAPQTSFQTAAPLTRSELEQFAESRESLMLARFRQMIMDQGVLE